LSKSSAETDLQALEQGEAVFEVESDLAGPISVAVAVQEVSEGEFFLGGRMVVVGDSDFLTNAYLDISGNRDLALNMIQWLSKDDRFISIRTRRPKFEPLLLDRNQKFVLVAVSIVAYPLLFLVVGSIQVLWRSRKS